MPDQRMMQRLLALAQDPTFEHQATIILQQRGFTALPPGYGSAAELALDYFTRTDPEVVNRFLQIHERANGPLPVGAEPPAQQQPQQQAPARPAAPPPPQQQPQLRIDPQTAERLSKLLAVDKVAAQAAKMRGGSVFRQYLTPEFERSAAAAAKKRGATIPQGYTAGEAYLAGLSLLSPDDLPALAQETRGVFGDATELRQAHSKLTTHRFADAVAVKVKKAAEYDPHRGVEVDEKAKEPTTRDVVAKAYREQKARAERNGGPPQAPRRVYSKEDLEKQKLKDKFFPDRARPIVLAGDVAHEIASEARDVAQAEAAINGDSVSIASESGGADNG